MTGGIKSVDAAIGSMVTELRGQGVLGSTTILITAKHGQSPIDPAKLAKIGSADTDVLTAAMVAQPNQTTSDDISLMWYQDSAAAAPAVAALQADQSGANTARIQTLLSGPSLQAQFGDPSKDPRTPNIIIQPIPGTIYTHSKAKVAEHGGFAEDDTHVAMIATNGANLVRNSPLGATIAQQVRTAQVAPTILSLLGLNPNRLDSVRFEFVQTLPGQ
jgi:arylsulfatase A-like enzyme